LNSILDENDLKTLLRPQNAGQSSSTPTAPTQTPVVPPAPIAATASIQPETFAARIPEKTQPQANSKTWLKETLKISWKFAAIFVFIFTLSFTLINFPAISKQLGYFYSYKLGNNTPSQAVPTLEFNALSEAKLIVPKIGVSAPIQWNVDEATFQDKLLTGLVHLNGTALPGQIGNIFITGHSSYYAWAKSDYKDVFALLAKLTTGDKIYIEYNNITYTYTVNGSNVVKPTQLEVLAGGSTPTLTLMTCVPIGTNLNRLVVTADQTASSGLF